MSDPTNSVAILVQGGGIGISMVLIWVIYKLVTNHETNILSALNRNSDAWAKNEIALTKLCDKLDSIAK